MSETLTIVTGDSATVEICEPTMALKFVNGKLMQGWRCGQLDGAGRLRANRIEYRPVEGQEP